MNARPPRDLVIIRPRILSRFGEIIAAMSTREGCVDPEPFGLNLSFRVGDDEKRVRENRARFFGDLGIAEGRLAIPRQVHGDNIVRVDGPGEFPDTDALFTSMSGIYLCVTVADCVPVLLFDPVARSVAIVHAGWRGTAASILRRTITRWANECGVQASRVHAFLGPSAGSCCYVVGEEVAGRIDQRFVSRRDGTIRADLKGANAQQLLDCGVPASQIEISPICTISDLRFHSHRRDQVRSGRMMAVIGLVSPPR